ncbi:MAG: hypothetical protein NTW87_32810 [Planctomycetota bacterium]|nr:hypothetical protein [Planctomycetota bacterium]
MTHVNRPSPAVALRLLLSAVCVLAASCRAEAPAEVQRLKNEALTILKANADKHVAPEEFAACLLKLEKAKALLAAAGDAESMLAQEIDASLALARRSSTPQVAAALEKLRNAGGAAPPPAKTAPPAPAAGKPPAEERPEGDALELLKEGDKLLAAKKYQEAIEPFAASLKLKDTVLAHKRLGKAHYCRAQQLSDELKPRTDAHQAKYKAVYQGAWRTTTTARFFDANDPKLKAWNATLEELRKENDVAQRHYQTAEQEFRAVLKLSPDQKDFDATGYVALCMSARPFFRLTGMQALQDFVKNYAPANDDERLLYEFCKTEIERLKKGG